MRGERWIGPRPTNVSGGRGCRNLAGHPERKGLAPGAAVSGRRRSPQPRRVLGGNPLSQSDTPAPAVNGQIN